MTSLLRKSELCIPCRLSRFFSSTSTSLNTSLAASTHSVKTSKVDVDKQNALKLKRQYVKIMNSENPAGAGPRQSSPHTSRERESPRSKPNWAHLPDWRRQNLSIRHKLSREASTPREESGGAVPGSQHWSPRKKLSPDAMDGIRTLHRNNPEYDVPKLANLFKVSPDAIRRILKSKWVPSPQEAKDREERWRKRKTEIVKARFGSQS